MPKNLYKSYSVYVVDEPGLIGIIYKFVCSTKLLMKFFVMKWLKHSYRVSRFDKSSGVAELPKKVILFVSYTRWRFFHIKFLLSNEKSIFDKDEDCKLDDDV